MPVFFLKSHEENEDDLQDDYGGTLWSPHIWIQIPGLLLQSGGRIWILPALVFSSGNWDNNIPYSRLI